MSKDLFKDPNQLESVLYIMYKTFRLSQNEAIEYGNTFEQFDIVLCPRKEENKRNNLFLQEGIQNHIDYKLPLLESEEELLSLMEDYSHIIVDFPYLKEDIAFVNRLKQRYRNKTFTMIENQTLVPVLATSNKEEYNARTIRNKIWSKVESYSELYPDRELFTYEEKAREELEDFILNKLPYYDQKNDPTKDYTSKLSAYLKYGFIAIAYIYQHVRFLPNSESFLEELIVRRELSYNFVYYNKNYDQLDQILYNWCYQTMSAHQFDHKEYVYTVEDYLSYNTHDIYFNQAMKNMVTTGYMHGYMRMYWCKKIIEWSPSFQIAYDIAIYLNNYYFLDGNTPNGYTGVAWCFGKHDRAWKEREIFGKIRYMNENGLKRKFDIKNYIKEEN